MITYCVAGGLICCLGDCACCFSLLGWLVAGCVVCLVLRFGCFGVYLVCVCGVYWFGFMVVMRGMVFGVSRICLRLRWVDLFRMRLCCCWMWCIYCCGLLGKDLTVS